MDNSGQRCGEQSVVKHLLAHCRKQTKRPRMSESDLGPGLHLTLKIKVLVLSKIAASSQRRVNIFILCSLIFGFFFLSFFHFSTGLYFKQCFKHICFNQEEISKVVCFQKREKIWFLGYVVNVLYFFQMLFVWKAFFYGRNIY